MEQNNNLKWVTSAQALGNYNLMLSFNDGANKVVTCKPLIDKYKIFTPLLDKSVFEKFSLDGWTVSWLNGTIDISPEYLYEEGKAV